VSSRMADDLDLCVGDAILALRSVLDRDWHVRARRSSWTCWEVIEHVADDLFSYAGQVLAPSQPLKGYVPFVYEAQRRGGPPLTIRSDPTQGNEGLLQVLGTCGAMLSTAARGAAPERRGWHPYGVSDPVGFAAMGTVETVVHLHDVSGALGFAWSPPPDLVRRALDRLFPHAPQDEDPWQTLLWATGRGELSGREALERWRWDSVPENDREPDRP
jgi:hypothetical protein